MIPHLDIPLLRALKYQDAATLIQLISNAEDEIVLETPIAGHSLRPIHFAAQQGATTALNIIYAKAPRSINLLDDYGQTALIWAASRGHLEAVQSLISKGAELNHATTIVYEDGTEHNDHGRTALHWAILNGYTHIAKSLLNAGAKASVLDGQHPVHIAAQYGHLDLVKFFIEKDRNLLNLKDDYGQTLLIWAASRGHIDIVRYCIEQDADLNVTTVDPEANQPNHVLIEEHGRTALHWALSEEYPNIADLLLAAGAATTLTNQGIHPIHIAAQKGYLTIVIILVIQNPALLNLKSANGYTPLMWTMSHDLPEQDHLDTTMFLLNAGAEEAAALTGDGIHPIHIAARRGYLDIVIVLIKQNPELLNLKSQNGYTPIMWAASRDHLDVVKWLIAEKADLNQVSTAGYTALQLASERHFYETVKTLNHAGANQAALWKSRSGTSLSWKANANSGKIFLEETQRGQPLSPNTVTTSPSPILKISK